MAAFTTIAAATVAIGGSIAKGALAGDAAKTASREAGRLRLEQDKLEKESVAKLEQNFYDAVRATTDVYDKQLERSNVMGTQILEAVKEGDQRGVAATAGKLKQMQDIALSETADKMAKQKLDIDMARAKAGEMSASEIAGIMDDRAAAAGLKSDALESQADKLRGASTGAFMDAGISALQAGVSLAGSIQGKAGDKAAEKLASEKGISIDDARSEISKYTGKEIRQFNRGDITAIDVSGRSNVIPDNNLGVTTPIETKVTQNNVEGLSNTPVDISTIGMIANYLREQEKQKEEEAFSDFNTILGRLQNGTFLGGLTDNIFKTDGN